MPVYVHHAQLDAIPDPFNAESLWQAPGFSLFSRRPLLRDVLERSPREQRGRAATRCFAHVIVTLPQEEIDDDYHLARGARARELELALAALHQRDFADLLGGDTVRYQVQGSDDLPPGAVGVRFGHAVYLPAQGEKIAFCASVSHDGVAWKAICPVYTGQRLALLGDAGGAGSGAEPALHGGTILLLNEGPGAQPVVQVRPRDAYECCFDAAHGYYAIRARHGDVQGSLLLRISTPPAAPRVAAATVQSETGPLAATGNGHGNAAGRAGSDGAFASAPGPVPGSTQGGGRQPAARGGAHAVWQPRPAGVPAGQPDPAAAAPWADATALPQPLVCAAAPAAGSNVGDAAVADDATYVPLARQRVTLAALALPRLSRYRDTGARQLDIALGGSAHIALAIDADDQLQAVAPGGRYPVAIPATLPQPDGRAITLLPPPAAMADRYCALLPLSQQASVQLPLAGQHRFGRQSPALAPLRVLDSPTLLHGAGAPASADRIGLSRVAFSFEMSPQGVRIARLAASQALFHLDQQLQFVAAIGPASAEAPYLLPHGHHVAAGHYVLRFDA